MPVTNEEIHSIADELVAKGQRPTLAAIRKALGGGSFSTISEAMKEWREQKHNQELLEARIPENLSGQMQQMFANICQLAMTEARAEVEKELAESKNEAEQARFEYRKLTNTYGEIESRIKGIVAQNKSLSDACERYQGIAEERSDQIDNLKDELKDEREKSYNLTKELGKLEIKAEHVSALEGKIEQLEGHIRESEIMLADARKEVFQYQKREKAFLRKIEELKAKIQQS